MSETVVQKNTIVLFYKNGGKINEYFVYSFLNAGCLQKSSFWNLFSVYVLYTFTYVYNIYIKLRFRKYLFSTKSQKREVKSLKCVYLLIL